MSASMLGNRSPVWTPIVRMAVAVLALVTFLALPANAWAAHSITVTFVRHGQSEGNVSGRLNTLVPGPNLTALGREQAQQIADTLLGDGIAYDGIYASNMVRTQETARPFALGLTGSATDVLVLPGLQEVRAGIYEGSLTPPADSVGFQKYVDAQNSWMLGLRFARIPGSVDRDGNVFDARVDAAVQTIYDSGDRYPVAFSHSGTIGTWTTMNVKNPDLNLAFNHPLPNTGVVVITGNPTDGWVLQSWDGIAVSQDPSLSTKLFVDLRDYLVTVQTAAYDLRQALATGDAGLVVKAAVDGIIDVAKATIVLPLAVCRDVLDAIVDTVTPGRRLPALQSTGTTTTLTADHPTPLLDTPDVTGAESEEESNSIADVDESATGADEATDDSPKEDLAVDATEEASLTADDDTIEDAAVTDDSSETEDASDGSKESESEEDAEATVTTLRSTTKASASDSDSGDAREAA